MDFMAQVGSLSLGSRLKRLSDHLFQEVSSIYQGTGVELSPTFFPLFYLLCSQGPQTVTGAAEALAVSHPAVSKLANRMIAEGWIIKSPDPQDERRQLLSISPRGEQLVEEIAPVWREIQRYIDQLMEGQHHHLLRSLDEFETALEQQPFCTTVLNRCRHTNGGKLEIIEWDPAYRKAFATLNMEWLLRYFPDQICERDHQSLNNPESFYLARGGAIFFARDNDRIVGCCALDRRSDEHYFLSKLGVETAWQGRGAGRKLVLAAIEKARQRGAREVSLETSSKLQAANLLYRNLGFHQIDPPGGRFEYDRTDTYMTLTF